MFGAPTPILRSFNEAHARTFYLDFLSFEEVFTHRFEAGLPLYMGVRKGDCVIHLSEHYGDATPGSALRIAIGDAAAFASMLQAKGFANARPGAPERTPWGSLEFAVTDPAGNRLTFWSEAAAD
jgi:uncharacterized glyoxalase superfamily protein PhnB